MKKKLVKITVVMLTFFCYKSVISQTFTETPSSLVQIGGIASSDFSDIDNDGDLDFIIMGSESTNSDKLTVLYTNDNGVFTVVPNTPFPGLYNGDVAFFDADNDGDEDLILTGEDNNNIATTRLYLNDGNGDFTKVSPNPFKDLGGSKIGITDFDNDGDNDVILNGVNWNLAPALSTTLYKNDGNGIFTEDSGQTFDVAWNGSVTLSDIDGDGDDDLLLTGRDFVNYMPLTRLYTNDNGTFNLVENTPFENVMFGAALFFDFDQDGDDDLLITGQEGSDFNPSTTLYRNDQGIFTEITQHPFPNVHWSDIGLSDVDSDGDNDLLLIGYKQEGDNSFVPSTQLFIADGPETYTPATEEPFIDIAEGSISLFDVNGDNQDDLIISGSMMEEGSQIHTSISQLYLNNNDLSVNEVESNNSFVIYPNPAKDIVNIKIDNASKTPLHYSIINMNGQKIIENKPVDDNTLGYTINVSGISKGIYILCLQSDTDTFYKKLIIE